MLFSKLPIRIQIWLYPLELRMRDRRQHRLDIKVEKAANALLAWLKSNGLPCYGIWHFGAIGIDPAHLVVIVQSKTDEEKTVLHEARTSIVERLHELLFHNRYPQGAIPRIGVTIESQQTVDRESDGHWWYHFK